jgi:uncharacterized protein (TIGR01244 family)
MSTQDIFNFLKVSDQLSTGGQPTADQLKSAAEEGFTAVINLLPSHQRTALTDEAGLVRSLGMVYHNIPVEWGNPKEDDFEAFENLLGSLPKGKTLLHCAANFRVTAFYSLYAMKHLGWSEAEAEAFRAQIWKGSDEPVWEQFIAKMREKIRRS